MTLDAGDESFHAPTTDDAFLWSETHMFTFDQRDGISGHIYPLFRRNAGVAALQVWLWDATGSQPWTAAYGRTHWHLPFPQSDLTSLRLAGLELDCVEPFGVVDVRYRDGELVALDLRFTALMPPHLAVKGPDRGHWDQSYRVVGDVVLHGRRHTIDTTGMRDKSWGVRPDDTRGTGGGYSFGSLADGSTFLAISRGATNTTVAGSGQSEHDATGRRRQSGSVPGYVVLDGEKATLESVTRRVRRRSGGMPDEIVLDLRDVRGRSVRFEGTCLRRLANQASPGIFTWLSTMLWRTPDGAEFLGQDQEYWSPDMLGEPLLRLDT